MCKWDQDLLNCMPKFGKGDQEKYKKYYLISCVYVCVGWYLVTKSVIGLCSKAMNCPCWNFVISLAVGLLLKIDYA